MLQCRSHLVWPVFEGSIPTCACIHWENFFVTLVLTSSCPQTPGMLWALHTHSQMHAIHACYTCMHTIMRHTNHNTGKPPVAKAQIPQELQSDFYNLVKELVPGVLWDLHSRSIAKCRGGVPTRLSCAVVKT